MKNKTNQIGRSMVEMLGVLAVIGVLSVGGIAGYTSAMNKHRANELLHQVSMRAATCVAQLASGNTSLSVADFGDYDGYSFTAAPNPSNANQFQITITGTISEAVCKSMKNTVGDATPVRNISENCSVVTFNNDMGTTDVIPTCNPACQTGEECVDGTCLPDADGASCMNNVYLCVGTNAPYCVQQYTNGNYTLTCQKNPMDYIDEYNNTLCGEGFSGCGDNLYCDTYRGVCVSSFEGIYCGSTSDCRGTDAPYCNPILENGETFNPTGGHRYECSSTVSKYAHCDSNADCAAGDFCNFTYIRCCPKTNPPSWCLE